ncbi:flagellar motor protein MotB [Yersinia enterocolitica]|uniref:Flagellar motor rotation protein MotB n=1 Tax=Yersinia enterocolitica subsp. palearctica serotype O:3 (strain DSM 13030 / CIP 106945 / Y11) TaxID=930944 RepID=A0A0H3NNT7_YERE1|nr:flagellar motor protein MotB [Yersinia enterocolitica]EHB19927.1 flagellar motor protein MotB [Yersinia enterocolitica subsp. palearctica PhRBD_Ye1]EKN3315216.1 flagellar motor protein MotB [Yersinia enterocolitica]EKN3318971.1 flagellar motor protein MotB [Yersinia enterocolitica]EKN3323069.1 flagellar motor protein MotB [Yersinia enterocolitica]EKN3334841.1 flagellar motor protein MotB [Yersinia enterocolitica]
MKHQNHPVILVKKRKAKHGQAHHGGSWKIAYADFMTAMMAFFLVMWLLSVSSPQELTQIAEYFRTPLKVALSSGEKSSDSTSPIPGGGDDPTQQVGEVRKHIDSEESRKEEYRLNKLREKLDQLIESDPRLKALRPHLLINMMDEGLRIQIIDSQNRPMFKMGSAQVEPYMRDILRAIAPILNDIPNKISLSGHTDDLPYASGERGYSNWELSADRANASRRELLAGGLDEGKVLRVVGMASTMRLKEQASDDPVNRRISILVLNKQTQHDIEHENLDNKALDIEKAESLKQIDSTGTTPAVASPATVAAPPATTSAAIPTAQSGTSGSVSVPVAVSTTSASTTSASTTTVSSATATESVKAVAPPATAPQTQQSSTENITRVTGGPTTSLPAAPASNAPVSPTSRDAQ